MNILVMDAQGGGIGKQIVHHFIQFIHIKISRIFFRQIKLYGQFLLFNQRCESRH